MHSCSSKPDGHQGTGTGTVTKDIPHRIRPNDAVAAEAAEGEATAAVLEAEATASGSKSQAEVQPSVPAAALSSEPSEQCNRVLNDANLLTIILILAASTGLHQAPKVFMMEACNTTIGQIARQKRDQIWACMRQVCCQPSADDRG